jgi:predicted tellurium resistance membrane protein TerC
MRKGGTKGAEYFAGYILEQSLSVDNLFVFILVFKYFRVPREDQDKVLLRIPGNASLPCLATPQICP